MAGIIGGAFIKLGIPPGTMFWLLIFTLIGSMVNIPIYTMRSHEVVGDRIVSYYGMRYRAPRVVRSQETVLAVNVGGAVIPVILCIYLLTRMDFGLYLPILVAGVTLVVNRLARPDRARIPRSLRPRGFPRFGEQAGKFEAYGAAARLETHIGGLVGAGQSVADVGLGDPRHRHDIAGLGFGLGFQTTDRYGANGLDSVGAYGWSGAYADWTQKHKDENSAIVLNGVVKSAPTINGTCPYCGTANASDSSTSICRGVDMTTSLSALGHRDPSLSLRMTKREKAFSKRSSFHGMSRPKSTSEALNSGMSAKSA